MKKKIILGVAGFLLPLFLLFSFFLFVTLFVSSWDDKEPLCLELEPYEVEESDTVPHSIDEFVKTHKDAYILSWKAGGFLPSASIAQTMVENGFNFTNPLGTSFWKAHNMGGGATRFSISADV